jgi:hypothetical protein
LGNILPNEEASVSFSLTANSQAPVGSVVTFNIIVTDDYNENTYSYPMIIGRQVLMGENEVSTCSCTFYDNGGYDRNYRDLLLLKTTIYPSQPGKSIQAWFSNFQAEADDNCGYDYLQIYDGPSLSSPLIGTFCGFDEIGNITSTDATGALTFQFFSDEAVSGSGWEARITCTGPDGIGKNEDREVFRMYPNPAKDRIYITLTDPLSDEFTLVWINAAGQRLLIMNSKEGYCDIDRTMIPAGNYLVELWQGNQKRGTQKIILE